MNTESEEKHDDNGQIELKRHSSLILVLNTPKGRGIFAAQPIPSGTVIETSPVLVLPLSDLDNLKQTLLDHYSYNWPIADPSTGKTVTTQALSLGLGSIFNHSKDQNVGFTRDVEREVIVYRTLRNVNAGKELCISYGGRLWFEDVDAKEDAEEDGENGLERMEIGIY